MKDKTSTSVVKDYFEKKGVMILKEEDLINGLCKEFGMTRKQAQTALDMAGAVGIVTRATNKRVTLYKHPTLELLKK